VVLSSLVVQGGNSATAMGTATIQVGTAAPMTNIAIKVTISVTNGNSSIMITSPDGTTTYAGGSAAGNLFLFT
jgi:hypothetical protein